MRPVLARQYVSMKTVGKYITIGLCLAVAVIGIGVLDHLLLIGSFNYRCWRVTHPGGPSVARFQYVVETTSPKDVDRLISLMDRSDMWWVDGLLRSWFGPGTEGEPPISGQAAWKVWWSLNGKNVKELHLITDPQF